MRNFFAKTSLLPLALLVGCAGLPATQTATFGQRHVQYALIEHGSPAVVFENGLGASMRSWSKVFTEIGKDTSVFAYNRPGYGNSDRSSTPRDGAHIVDELRALLRARGLEPPYLLVGHSLGGLYMQLFTRKYPDEVLGLVLVDSTHPTQMEGGGALENQPWLVRLLFPLFVTGEQRREFDAAMPTGREVLQLPTASTKPVIILSAIDRRDHDAVRHANKKRADFLRLYPDGRQSWVESGHFIQSDKPELVISEIRKLLAR